MIKAKLQESIMTVLKKLGANVENVEISYPTHSTQGDFSTNVAFKYARQLNKNPLEFANEITKLILKESINFLEKVQIEKPGFINFWILDSYYLSHLQSIEKEQIKILPLSLGKQKKIMIEFAHPNTHKLFHIGHLRNISSGESLSRILTVVGNKVIRSNYQGDVGLHIAKCLWQLGKIVKTKGPDLFKKKTLQEKIALLGQAYSSGSKAFEEDARAKKEIVEVNKMIYEQHGDIISLWKETRQWSLDYFDSIYARVYTKFDRLYFESEFAERGKKIIQEALKKKILVKSKEAVIFDGKKYGLDTRVFLNALGIPTYEGKELALAEKEFSDFGLLDKCMHVVGPEQNSFFKVTFKVEELLDPKKYKDKQKHLIGGWVRLKHGKMSSRSGVVVEGQWLIDEAKKKIQEKFNCPDETAEVLAVASVKYSFLKKGISSEIVFDFDESISLDGNSAPYLIYTYVRTKSVLSKVKNIEQFKIRNINPEEKALLQSLHKFPEVVYESAKNFSPSIIANYLYDLAQSYNLFYQKHPILRASDDLTPFRLVLTKNVGEVLRRGLDLLGIKTVEKM